MTTNRNDTRTAYLDDCMDLILPEYLLSALFNGDTSSFSLDDDGGEEEDKKLAMLLEYVHDSGFGCPTHYEDDIEFSMPDMSIRHIYGYACDCVTVYFPPRRQP